MSTKTKPPVTNGKDTQTAALTREDIFTIFEPAKKNPALLDTMTVLLFAKLVAVNNVTTFDELTKYLPRRALELNLATLRGRVQIIFDGITVTIL